MGQPQRAVRPRDRRALIAVLAASAAAALTASVTACSANPDLSRASDTTPPITASPLASSSASPTSLTPTSPAPSTAPPPAHAIWHPKPGLTWQWQLTEPVDTSIDAQVYDIDGTENSAAVVSALHAAGRKVICYVNAGADENFRPDASHFPGPVIGQSNGWPGERWLDVRQLGVLRPIIAARFKACAEKGFDGIEADNVDGYVNDTGFPLTAGDQLAFNRMIASVAHADGLAIGLKNDLDQIPQLTADFDFAVNEQCAQYSECDSLEPFIAAGKAVFHVEYSLPLSQFCTQTSALHFSSMRKNTVLDAPRWPCPTPAT
jgi:hypothetical protein